MEAPCCCCIAALRNSQHCIALHRTVADSSLCGALRCQALHGLANSRVAQQHSILELVPGSRALPTAAVIQLVSDIRLLSLQAEHGRVASASPERSLGGAARIDRRSSARTTSRLTAIASSSSNSFWSSIARSCEAVSGGSSRASSSSEEE